MSNEMQFLLWLQNHMRSDILNHIFVFITNFFGQAGILWIAAAVLLLLFKKTRPAGIACAIALAVQGVLINLVIKPIVARPRPYDACSLLIPLVTRLKDYSFPSGHTGCAFSAAIVMAKMLPKKIGVPAVIIACLLGFSRMYVGVHYPTDVLAGALIGIGSAIVGMLITQKITERKAQAV
ncbi:MAG: phosphatase PAP2 family protein [Eubacteriales bacterium]|jgi:undecaprenyl-diphosphatase|nr:phosphatase PAP2 family protein [Lachnospiraceae bacterium]MDD5859947.1 phosphatase PAP2 family protein [Eubacteriales bacterium]MCH4062920.1 phosphatase PAP2 family protein [Lachnospiraceae bacterium]MCH4104226.1 phosphatase PAP2 family protein [Lachnospiraceae bacterium]MCI1309113.1 phosphatase PAP2 family protein [Lachnospiraceae bacterium]